MRPLLEQVVFVLGRRADRRLALAPRHPGKPRLDVLALQRSFYGRVLGVGHRVVVGPGRLLQVEGAAVPDAAAVGIREAAAIEKLRRQPRRVETAERRLGVRGIGQAEGADAPVAPALPHQPGERVAAVLGLAQVFREAASRFVAPTAILVDDRIAVLDEVAGHLGAGTGPRGRCRPLGAARRRFVVWGALQQYRERAAARRAIDIRRQPGAVPRCDDQIPLDNDRAGPGHLHAALPLLASRPQFRYILDPPGTGTGRVAQRESTTLTS